MHRLQGKVALVTGAAATMSGVGFGADVSDSGAVNRMFDRVATQFGRLDVLVNNAGISGFDNRPDRAAELRRVMLAVHLDGTLRRRSRFSRRRRP